MLGKILPAQAQLAPGAAPVARVAATSPIALKTATVPGTAISETRNAATDVVSPFTTADKDILAARGAFERRDFKSLAAAKERFSAASGNAHRLSQYPQYWWLLANLAQTSSFAVANAAEIRSFLNANPNSVVADTVRREWLKIVGKLDQWELFSSEIALLNAEDADITCHNWRYRLSRNDREALAEAKAAWAAARSTPDSCDAVFAALAAEKMLPTGESWLRVRRLLENNQLADARKSAALIPGVPSNFERNTALIGQNPAHYLQHEKLQPSSPPSVELFLFAVTRLARTDADRAATLLDAHGNKLPAGDLGYAWAQVGLYAGMQHDANTLAWFERARAFRLSDTQAGWKARTALRVGDWPAVQAAIGSMSDAEKRDAAWRYWRARSAQQAGDVATARGLRESLARENNFYGVLAAEELGMPLVPDWQGWKPSRADVDAAMQRPAIARALALYRLDLKAEGLREWLVGIRNMDDRELLAAAEAARSANVPDRAINTAEKTLMVHDFAQRFPTPHYSDLSPRAKSQGLDEAWVYGLIRQECRFMVDAKSRVGAAGLMQLMPATAVWAAKKANLDRFSLARVTDVPTNLSLGSFYLRNVLDTLGHPVLATAGYNAGPGRARRWRAAQPLEGAIYAESIPFAETRDYVKKVMVNAWFYAHQAGATTRRLKDMMGFVPGSSEGSVGVSSMASAANQNKVP